MKKTMASALMLFLCLPVSLEAQVTATPAVRVMLPAPPKTVSPAPGESRATEEPLTFRWAPVFLESGKQAAYRLVIAPIFTGQAAAEALEQNQPLFNRIVSDPTFEYAHGSPSFGLYPMAVGFAWQVQAVDTGGHPVAANLGKSEVSSFTLVNKLPPPVVKKVIPATLIAGTFRIDVEEYDQPSKSLNPNLPSGIGRVKFTCPPHIIPFPWKSLHPALKSFAVVQSVSDSLTQIHISDALLVDPSIRVGDKIQLSLPQRSESSQMLIDRNLVIGILKGLNGPDGIRVRFRDVQWTGGLAPVVLLSAGIAWYPAAPVSPPVPAEIAIEPGFSLDIDSLVITPSKATVRGAIVLPPCIVSATACTRSSIGLPWTAITGQCELYAQVPDSSFGPFYVGETGVQVSGKGYTIDFSSTYSDPAVIPHLANSWKGVVLTSGTTPDPPAEVVLSNRGYVKAKYSFSNGLIVSSGLEARLNLVSQFAFRTVEPMGYLVVMRPPGGFLSLGACGIVGGEFLSGEVQLPIAAIRDELGGGIRAFYDTLYVQNDMDLFGAVRVPGGFTWGEYSKTYGTPRYYQLSSGPAGTFAQGYFYLAARQLPPYYPLVGNVFTLPNLSSPLTALASLGEQGVTLTSIGHRDFTIWTQDVPNVTIFNPGKLSFNATSVFPVWMNIIGTGVHTEVRVANDIWQLDTIYLGPTWCKNPQYLGETPLKVSFKWDDGSKERQMKMQFVESATWYSDFGGKIYLGGPLKGTAHFSNLTFTSTADAGGAQLDLSPPMDMTYWGVKGVPKDSTKPAGIMCVKLGMLYLTAAGISEPRHFTNPFWLTWGEIKASGNTGRLFFDYNTGGQKFDRFPYTPNFVKLSDYTTAAPTDTGFVITHGTLSFSFFGAKPVWVYDWKSPNRTGSPFGGRTVRIPASSPYGAGSTDLHLLRDWGDGLAQLAFDVQYDSLAQEGFAGPGTGTINKGVAFAVPLPGNIVVRPLRSCFSLNHETDVTIALAPVMTTSALNKIWGCGCIIGDNLEQIAVGGEMSASNGLGASILARSAGDVTVVMGFSPSRTDFLLAGDAFVVLLSTNAEIVGYMTLSIDRDAGYAEGYAKGIITLDAIVAGLSGQGEFQWHLGTDNETIQGRVAVGMYGMGWPAVGAGLESGVWLGINSNKDDVWVMDGISGRFGLNKGALPQNITGFYAYLSFSASVSYYVVSGGYQAYAGIGGFAGFGGNTVAGFGLIGNVGLYVWGKIAGGLVSADAWGDLQMIAGVPPAFQGTLGLDACVLWIFCGSVTVNAGFNANQGFYLY